MRHLSSTTELRAEPEGEGRVGLELEFAGIDEATAAETVAKATGGQLRQIEGQSWSVETPIFGTCDIYLDTQFDETVKRVTGPAGLAALRSIVPVELVTEPFPVTRLNAFAAVTSALRDAGARGSRDGLFYGFGTHVNVEVDPEDAPRITAVCAAYALIEDFIRNDNPIDVSRRLLPFVAPYPDGLVDGLSEDLPETMGELIDMYLFHAPSRDHGLDLLPILALHDEERVKEAAEGLSSIGARPAFHFRLPDCRIDEAGWSVEEAWDDWALVQTVADDSTLLNELRTQRRRWRGANPLGCAPWFKTVFDVLADT